MIGFGYLRMKCSERIREWMGKPNDPSVQLFASNELAGETGEVCNEVKKLERSRMGIAGGHFDTAKLADELADVVICVDNLAQCHGINLSAAIVAKFNKTSEKHGFKTRMVAEESGALLIAAERQRQLEVEGWTPKHDDDHDQGEMAFAAAVYALPDHAREKVRRVDPSENGGRDLVWKEPVHWPWDVEWFKPTPGDRIRELVKAGALIAAEIDRLQRRNSARNVGGAS